MSGPQHVGDVISEARKGLTAAACCNCQHWNSRSNVVKQYQNLPYRVGRCYGVIDGFAGPEPGHAEVATDGEAAALLTSETFFCALFKRKPKSDPRRDGQ